MRFSSRRAEKKWHSQPDDCTKKERLLLDELQRVRPDMFPLKMRRYPDGTPHFFKPLVFRGGLSSRYGCYLINFKWIKKEIEKRNKELEEERQIEILNAIGAYI